MRRLLLITALVVSAAGCSNPCRDLGDRICRCAPTGTTEETCKRQVDNAVKAADPTKDQDQACDGFLTTCVAPDGVDFCEWVQSTDGKELCGLAYAPPQ